MKKKKIQKRSIHPEKLRVILFGVFVGIAVLAGSFYMTVILQSTKAFVGPGGTAGIGSGLIAVDGSGNMAIGTSTVNPSYKLLVVGSGLVQGPLSATSFTGTMQAGNVGAGTFGSLAGNGNFNFPASLAVATTSYAYPLNVSGDVGFTGTLQRGTVPWARLSGHPTITAGTGLSGGGDLSAGRTISLANTTVAAGSYTLASITVDAQGRITSAANGANTVTAGSYTQPNVTVDAYGRVTTISNGTVAVTPGSYTQANITVDAYGRVTAAANGSATYTEIPAGMVAMFNTSCPSGWTRFSAMDGRFPYGSASYGSTGGATNHRHWTDPGSGTTGSDGSHSHGIGNYGANTGNNSNNHGHGYSYYNNGGTYTAATTAGANAEHAHGYEHANGSTDGGGSHTHSFDTPGADSDYRDNIPPYLTMIFCLKS